MNYNAHVKFVIKALEKLESRSSVESLSKTRNADTDLARSDDSSSSQIRNELGRVAYVVGA
jgi:peroxiredoxin Q/BCP